MTPSDVVPAGRVLLATVALVLGACTAAASPGTGDAGDASEDLASLRFRASTVDGRTLDTTYFIGRAPVAFWVWAPGCPSCGREAAKLRRAMDRFGARIHVVGVAGGGGPGRIRAFVDQHRLGDIPHAVDPDGRLLRRMGVRALPAWVLVGRDGQVRRLVGMVGDSELHAALVRLADRPPTVGRTRAPGVLPL